MKWSGVVFAVSSVLVAGSVPVVGPLAFVGIVAGIIMFFEGLKRETIKSICERLSDENNIVDLLKSSGITPTQFTED